MNCKNQETLYMPSYAWNTKPTVEKEQINKRSTKFTFKFVNI